MPVARVRRYLKYAGVAALWGLLLSGYTLHTRPNPGAIAADDVGSSSFLRETGVNHQLERQLLNNTSHSNSTSSTGRVVPDLPGSNPTIDHAKTHPNSRADIGGPGRPTLNNDHPQPATLNSSRESPKTVLPSSDSDPGPMFNSDQPQTSLNSSEGGSSQLGCGAPHENVYFVKLHKVGSTTLQNIVTRFGLSRGLRFALFQCQLSITYPLPPLAKFLVNKDPRPYNILHWHTQYSRPAALQYMPPDTKTITLIRRPFSQLLSTFAFFQLTEYFNMSSAADPVREFLQAPARYERRYQMLGCGAPEDKWVSLTCDPQAHHLGWGTTTGQSGEDGGLQEWLRTIAQEMEMVLILERFSSSLVLLGRRLCWPLRHLLHFTQMATSAGRRLHTVPDPTLLAQHRAWSPADYALYEFFDAKLSADIEREPNDFAGEVEHFGEMREAFAQFCRYACTVLNEIRVERMSAPEARELLAARRMYVAPSRWERRGFNLTARDCLDNLVQKYYYQLLPYAQWPAMCEHRPEICDEDKLVGRLPLEEVRHRGPFHTDYCVRNIR